MICMLSASDWPKNSSTNGDSDAGSKIKAGQEGEGLPALVRPAWQLAAAVVI